MSVKFKDYYEILGVQRSATDKEIKSAFRKLARKYHPDVNASYEDKFKEINEAYEVLGDAEKRKRYDSLGANWRHGAGFEPPPGYQNINLDDILRGGGFGGGGFQGGSGFSDFFDMLFGNMGMGGMGNMGGSQFDPRSGGFRQQQRQSAHQPVDMSAYDVEQPLYLTLEEVAQGAERKIQSPFTQKNLTVTIPKGVQPGGKIRLSQEGRPGPGGQRGNLILIVQYTNHPHFQVQGLDIIHEVSIPVHDLVLGTEIQVPTLTQGKVTLTIPPGTQPGKSLRLKGQGLPAKQSKGTSNDPPGNLLVKIKGTLPEAPSEELKALYQQIKTLCD